MIILIGTAFSQSLEKKGNYWIGTIEKSFSVKPDGKLILDEVKGDVVITTWEQNTVKIHEIKKMDIFSESEANAAMEASDDLCRFHASVFLDRRRQAGGFSREFLGVGLLPAAPPKALIKGFSKVFDFVQIPFVWRDIQRDEQSSDYSAIDKWVAAGAKAGLKVRGGPVLSFGVQSVPDWMYVRENDYEAVAGFAREHVRRSVQRYAGKIDSWIVY